MKRDLAGQVGHGISTALGTYLMQAGQVQWKVHIHPVSPEHPLFLHKRRDIDEGSVWVLLKKLGLFRGQKYFNIALVL